jgi:hypothetical protein
MVIVGHRPSTLANADKILVLKDGRAESFGPRDEVLPRLRKVPVTTGIVFRETTTDYENSWHRAPRRQYVISLAGGISSTASDGETRHNGAGEIVLVEGAPAREKLLEIKGRGRRPRS